MLRRHGAQSWPIASRLDSVRRRRDLGRIGREPFDHELEHFNTISVGGGLLDPHPHAAFCGNREQATAPDHEPNLGSGPHVAFQDAGIGQYRYIPNDCKPAYYYEAAASAYDFAVALEQGAFKGGSQELSGQTNCDAGISIARLPRYLEQANICEPQQERAVGGPEIVQVPSLNLQLDADSSVIPEPGR